MTIDDKIIRNLTFTDLVLQTPRAIRVRRATVQYMAFTGVDMHQENTDEVMIKFELVKLEGELKISGGEWTSDGTGLSSGSPWASFNFVNQTRSPVTGKWLGQFTIDGLRAAAPEDNDWVMEIAVEGVRNFYLKQSTFTDGAGMSFASSLEVDISNCSFTDTGITSTTTANMTVRDSEFNNIRAFSNSPFARSIFFKDASAPNRFNSFRYVRISNCSFNGFRPNPDQAGSNVSAITFSASPARFYFDSVVLTLNRFNFETTKGLYAVTDEDFEPPIQASRNWWGSSSGPEDLCNPKGKGARIFSDRANLRYNVDYRPWCSNPSCSDTTSNRKSCPWAAWVWAVVILSAVLGLVCIVVVLLLIRQYVIDRRYKILSDERDGEYTSRLLKRVKNLDELLTKYSIVRILPSQLDIGERIGEGTFGYVHKAIYTPHQELFGFVDLIAAGKQKEVAVKYIKNRWLSQYDSLGNFLDEIKIMSMVDHPHVQTLIGLCVDHEEQICMVSEFMSRGSLTTVIDSKLLDNAKKLDISLDTAYGMSHLHSKGAAVVHRDLKPGNILVSKEWVARVADFGTSIAARQQSTVASAVGTTPVYLSPEAALHNEFSQASDVFAYGITLYELWAEEISYPSLTDGGLSVIQGYAIKHLEPDLPRLSALPHAISMLIRHCTAFEPEERPSFHQILTHLVNNRSRIREGLGPSSRSLGPRKTLPQPDYGSMTESNASTTELELDRIDSVEIIN